MTLVQQELLSLYLLGVFQARLSPACQPHRAPFHMLA